MEHLIFNCTINLQFFLPSMYIFFNINGILMELRILEMYITINFIENSEEDNFMVRFYAFLYF